MDKTYPTTIKIYWCIGQLAALASGGRSYFKVSGQAHPSWVSCGLVWSSVLICSASAFLILRTLKPPTSPTSAYRPRKSKPMFWKNMSKPCALMLMLNLNYTKQCSMGGWDLVRTWKMSRIPRSSQGGKQDDSNARNLSLITSPGMNKLPISSMCICDGLLYLVTILES